MPISAAALERFDFLKDLPWLEKSVLGNSVYAYLLTLGSFLFLWAFLHFLRAFGARKLEAVAEGTQSDALIFCRDLIRQIRPFVFPLVALHIAAKRLTMASGVEKAFAQITMVAVVIQIVWLVTEMISFLILHSRILTRSGDAMAKNTARNIVVLIKLTIWAGAIIFLLDNAGFNVSTFLTGLGIGGVAIALAAQAVLGDAFSSFAIALDRPFEVGDSVTVDGLSGEVEYIGLKTTRVRSTGGELLIFANSDLTKSRIRNFKRMMHRNVTIKLGFVYDTPIETLRRIPELLKAIVESTPNTRFGAAHFVAYGESALQFEVGYVVTDPSASVHMAAQQEINYKIREVCDREGLELAFGVTSRQPLKASEPRA